MEYPKTTKNKVKRIPKRGHYDQKTIFEILDAGYICHLGFVMDNQPFVIPTIYGREEDTIYLHGASTSRMLVHLSSGAPLCMTVTHLDGLVLARSVFNHSMNYRSVVLFGKGELIEDKEEKMNALHVVTEQILKGRWDEARLPNDKELKATHVIKFKIDEGSAKIRTGAPGDEKADYDLPIWAGVVPIVQQHLPVEVDPDSKFDLEVPDSVKAIFESK